MGERHEEKRVVIILVAIGAFAIQPAAAENCMFHKTQFLVDTFVEFAELLPGYDSCGIRGHFTLMNIRGNLIFQGNCVVRVKCQSKYIRRFWK